jgi:hypothetical protein
VKTSTRLGSSPIILNDDLQRRLFRAPLLFTPDVPQPLYNHIANARGDNRDNQVLLRENVLQVPQQALIPSASAAFHLTHQKV